MASSTTPDNAPLTIIRDSLMALRWEWFRLSRRVAFWVVIGLMCFVVVINLTGLVVAKQLEELPFAFSPHDFPEAVMQTLGAVGPFLAVVLASMVFGGDFEWGTLRPLVARGLQRWQVGLGKLLLAGAVFISFWVVAWGLAAVIGLLAGTPSPGIGGSVDAEPGSWGQAMVRLGTTWLAVVAYVGLGAVLTTTGRSTSFGLGVAVGIILVELVAYPLADIGAELLGFSVNEYTRWTLGGATSGLVNGDGDLTRWVFLLAVLVYVVLLWGLTLVIMTRRDLSSGNG